PGLGTARLRGRGFGSPGVRGALVGHAASVGRGIVGVSRARVDTGGALRAVIGGRGLRSGAHVVSAGRVDSRVIGRMRGRVVPHVGTAGDGASGPAYEDQPYRDVRPFSATHRGRSLVGVRSPHRRGQTGRRSGARI